MPPNKLQNPRKAKKQYPRTKAALATKDLLSRLPYEILIDIAEYLLNDLNESTENYRKKIDQEIAHYPGTDTECSVYQHNPESPIMTSFQSFSVVNRRTYSICRPIIWRYLKFPSAISSPMSVWHQEILPKHGFHVEVVDVGLRPEWFQTPPVREKHRHQYPLRSSSVHKINFIEEDLEYWEVESVHSDNLNISEGREMCGPNGEHSSAVRDVFGLCPSTLIKVLSQCQRLSTLCLNCLDRFRVHRTAKDLHNLKDNLISLFSDLGRIQHLKIRGPRYSMSTSCFIEPISQLPLIESLELAHLSAGEGSEVDSLPACLSNLKNLKQLVLKDVDALDSSWSSHQAPPQLVDVTIRDCFALCLSDMPGFICAWAPQLTHLDIKFHEQANIFPTEDVPEFHPAQVHLPALTHLSIWPHATCHYVHRFRNCKSLCHLTFYHLRRHDCLDDISDDSSKQLSELADFITNNAFPNLKSITLHIEPVEIPLDRAKATTVSIMEEFCKFNGIIFSLLPGSVHIKLLPSVLLFARLE